jgi:hypothetical protein
MRIHTMTTEQVKSLFCLFFNVPENETNVIDWKFEIDTLTIKAENFDDGMIEIFTITGVNEGYSASKNEFEVIK